MAPKPHLTEDQILEVVRLHNRGMSIEAIAPKFDRCANTIRKIVLGGAYRGVTGRAHSRGGRCSCQACERAAIEERNVMVAEAATVEFCCAMPGCGARVTYRAVAVYRSRGRVLCDAHGRRRK